MLLHEAVVVVVVEEEGGMEVAVATTGDRMVGIVEVGVVIEVVMVVVGNIRNVAIAVVVGKLMDRNSWEGDMPLEDVLAVAAI